MSAFETLLTTLLRTSWQGALFIAFIWLVCRLFPKMPAALRCGLWWAACLKLLLGLAWMEPVRIPVLPAPPTIASTGEALPATASFPRDDRVGRVVLPAPETPHGASLQWGSPTGLLVGLWGMGLLISLGLTLRDLRRTRWVIARSKEAGGWAAEAFDELKERLGLAPSIELRVSEEVVTPQVVGLARPVVLLPAPALGKLSPAELAMTLCHELVHVRRGDLRLGWVPAAAQRLFFFHPLAALAAREYALAREAACDAEVLRVLGSAPQAYGRLLLRLGVAPRETGLAAAGASPSLHNLKRRLQMLQHTSEPRRRLRALWWLAAAALLVGLVPIQIVASEPPPAPPAPPAPPVAAVAPVPPPAPIAAVAPGTPAAPVAAMAPAPPNVPGAAAAPAAPGAPPAPAAPGAPAPVPAVAAPPAPPAPPAPVKVEAPGHRYALAAPPAPPVRMAALAPAPPAPPPPPPPPASSWWGGDDGESFIYLSGDDSTVFSGSWRDIEKAKDLRKGKDIVWFERDGKGYVIRDAATLKQVGDLLQPQMELGRKQGELGEKQGELGAKQGELGAKQGELGAKQGELAAQQAALAGGHGDKAEYATAQDELARLQGELGRKQAELGRLQGELGQKQAELGRQQAELSRRIRKELGTLIDQAIRTGKAEEVR